jgi:hypothetical protein
MSPAELEARVARLERSNRVLRGLFATFVAIAAVPLLAAYVPANDKLEASEFVVRDKAGAVRARLYLDEQGKTRLVLRDRDGHSTVNLAAGEGASLALGDKDDKSTVTISAAGSAKGVVMLESDGKPKAVLTKPKGVDSKDPLDSQDPWASPD